jgi:hypothetical protein
LRLKINGTLGDLISRGSDFAGANLSRLIPLAAGDYVSIAVYQDSGGALNLDAAEFSAMWVST